MLIPMERVTSTNSLQQMRISMTSKRKVLKPDNPKIISWVDDHFCIALRKDGKWQVVASNVKNKFDSIALAALLDPAVFEQPFHFEIIAHKDVELV